METADDYIPLTDEECDETTFEEVDQLCDLLEAVLVHARTAKEAFPKSREERRAAIRALGKTLDSVARQIDKST